MAAATFVPGAEGSGDEGRNQQSDSSSQLTSYKRFDLAQLFKNAEDDLDVTFEILDLVKSSMSESEVWRGPEAIFYFEVLSRLMMEAPDPVCLQALSLVEGSLPQAKEDSLDRCMLCLMPSLINLFGRHNPNINEAAVQTLHVYMRYTNNWQHFVRSFIHHGLENVDDNVRRGCLTNLSAIFTPEFANENLFSLVEALFRLLLAAASGTSGEDRFLHACLTAIQRLGRTLGPQVFDFYFSRLDEILRAPYRQILTQRNIRETSVEMNPLRPLVQENITLKEQPVELLFGIFSPGCVERLRQPEWRTRVEGVELLKLTLKENPEPSVLVPHLAAFLQLLSKLLMDSCFKVVVLTLNVYEILIGRLKHKMTRHLRTVVGALAKHLGDLRVVVKEQNVKVLHSLMCETHPKVILDILLEFRNHKNPRVREEVMNRVTAAILTFPSYNFDFASLCRWIAPSLIDPKRRVRLAALEVTAALAQAMGPARAGPLMAAIDQLEMEGNVDGLTVAVQSRLARKTLPRCTIDGMVMYAIGLPSSASTRSHIGADIDWVLQASGSTGSSTPPTHRAGRLPPTHHNSDEDNLTTSPTQSQVQQVMAFQETSGAEISNLPVKGNDTADIGYLDKVEETVNECLESVLDEVPTTSTVEEQFVLEDIEDDEHKVTEDDKPEELDEPVACAPSFPTRPVLARRSLARSAPATAQNGRTPITKMTASHQDLRIRSKSLDDPRGPSDVTTLSRSLSGWSRGQTLHLTDGDVEAELPDETHNSNEIISEEVINDDIEEHALRKSASESAVYLPPTNRRAPPNSASPRPPPRIPVAISRVRHNATATASSTKVKEDAVVINREGAAERIRNALRLMADEDWNRKTDGMELICGLCRVAPGAVRASLHPLVRALVAEIFNLRSSVSRSAIRTLASLFPALQKQMEPELDLCVGALLKKSGENSGFIREDVDKALASITAHVTPQKTLFALLTGGASHKNDFVRKTCSQFSWHVVEAVGGPRALSMLPDKLLPATAHFVMDRIPLTRYYGRLIFGELLTSPDFSRLCQRHIPPSTAKNIRSILDSVRKKGAGEKPGDRNRSKERKK